MSYGKLNIWLRDLDCCPKNFWKVELVVKTCTGKYLVDFNPDVIEKLHKAYPNYEVKRDTRDGETTIWFYDPKTTIKHIEVAVPPGCYLVRAWVCKDNLWSDRVMAIVGCGEDVCVNLIVPSKEGCIRGVIVPVLKAGYDMKLDPAKFRPVIDGLLKTGKIEREILVEDLRALIEELGQLEVDEAQEYAAALKYMYDAVGFRGKAK